MSDFKAFKAQLQKEHDQKLRRELRNQRKALKAHIRKLKARRKDAVRAVREWCKRSEQRVRDRAKDIRAEHRRQANQEIAALRSASKAACAKRTAKAKKRGLTAQQIAEQERRSALRDEKLLTQATSRLRKRQVRTSARERRTESDDEVRSNIAPELADIWAEVASSIKPKRNITRTEQFLQWVEEHPEEIIRMQADLGDRYADDVIAEAEAENRRLEKLLKSSRKLSPGDLEKLGIQAADMVEAGFSPTDPADVLAFLEGTTEYYQSESAVPF